MWGSRKVEGRIPPCFAIGFWTHHLDVFGMDAEHYSHESLGFLAVRQREPHGFFGGYLIVNARARPVEFHCTLPVQPTRAQQILYGKTLIETVCGELIGRALVDKATARPRLVLSDCEAVLALRHWVDLPIVHVVRPQEHVDSAEGFLVPESAYAEGVDAPSRYVRRVRDGVTFSCISSYVRDLDSLSEIDAFDGRVDWFEPFSRIVEALAEAHPRSRAA